MSAEDWPEPFFVAVAQPRLPGTEAVARVENIVARQLREFGFTVRREPFLASPRRLHAAAVSAAGLGWVALALAPLLILPLPAWPAALTSLAAVAGVAVLGVGIVLGHLPFPSVETEATNLVATTSDDPWVWLVAHSDSKAQPLSLRGRVVAVILGSIGVLGLVVCGSVRIGGPLSPLVVAPWIGATLLGAAALSRRPLRDGSPGAVDNASGIVAALCAAQLLRTRPEVGVLITGAEEFGMEGARAWTAEGADTGVFVNFDGIDGRGKFNLMRHGMRNVRVARGGRAVSLAAVISAVRTELREGGYAVRRAPLPLGVFVDGSVLAARGMVGVTVSRGDLQTLGVVHTSRDTPARMDIRGAVACGRTVGRVLHRVLEDV